MLQSFLSSMLLSSIPTYQSLLKYQRSPSESVGLHLIREHRNLIRSTSDLLCQLPQMNCQQIRQARLQFLYRRIRPSHTQSLHYLLLLCQSLCTRPLMLLTLFFLCSTRSCRSHQCFHRLPFEYASHHWDLQYHILSRSTSDLMYFHPKLSLQIGQPHHQIHCFRNQLSQTQIPSDLSLPYPSRYTMLQSFLW